MPQCYAYAILVLSDKIHEISYTSESVTPQPMQKLMEPEPKLYAPPPPPPMVGGHNQT